MASRRPPLFELLQQQDGPRQGRGSGAGRSGSLGQPPEPAKTSNGQAHGAVERKPDGPSKPSTLEGLSEAPAEQRPATKRDPKPEVATPKTEPSRKSQPVAQPEAQPVAQPARSEPAPKPERPAGAADWSGMHPKSAIRVRMFWIYGGVIAVIAIVVGAWALSYSLAESKWRAQFEDHLQKSEASAPIQDPVTVDREAIAQADPTPLSGVERRDPILQAERPRVEQETRTVEPDPAPVAPVDVTVDVRQPGHNYMKLASGMTAERATGLAKHLAANGVPAMALAEGRGGYGLYTSYAVPSGQFSATSQQRGELERRVYQLLGTTPQELGGPYTPRDHLWVRFDG